MLQQILSEMYVDPELLNELDDEQKQILFCKMREEQVRRWLEHEKAYEIELKNKKFVPPRRDKKSVQFLLGTDGQPWTWIMGEHKNDRNIDDILEDEARKKAMILAEKETDQFLETKGNELSEKLTEALLIENNNNVITEVPKNNQTNNKPVVPKEPPKVEVITPTPTIQNSTPSNKVFQNIKIFEKVSTPSPYKSTPTTGWKSNMPKYNGLLSSNIRNFDRNGTANDKPKTDLLAPRKETRSASVKDNIKNFNEGRVRSHTGPPKPELIQTKSEPVVEKKKEEVVRSTSSTSVSSANDYKKPALENRLSFVNDYNGINEQFTATPPVSTAVPESKTNTSEQETPVKYRAPQPPVPISKTSNGTETSQFKVDDQAVRRFILMGESPVISPTDKPKLRPKPSPDKDKDKDSWLLQQKEKVKERLKEQRSSEIYQQIKEGRKRLSQISDEINKEQEEIWQEQERKAKEAEKNIRDLARKARELHRRSSMMDDEDKPEIKPKPTQTTSRSRDARLYTKPQIIDWFNKEELPKNVAFDPKTGEVAPWFHGIINREQAEYLLQDLPTGTFLVRLNDRIKGYVISYKTSDRCKHYLIDASSGNYQFFGANQIVHSSLVDLVKFHKSKPISSPGQEYLTLPCRQPTGNPNYSALLS